MSNPASPPPQMKQHVRVLVMREDGLVLARSASKSVVILDPEAISFNHPIGYEAREKAMDKLMREQMDNPVNVPDRTKWQLIGDEAPFLSLKESARELFKKQTGMNVAYLSKVHTRMTDDGFVTTLPP